MANILLQIYHVSSIDYNVFTAIDYIVFTAIVFHFNRIVAKRSVFPCFLSTRVE
jgi:hypothetical protein